MTSTTKNPYAGHRFPPELISYTVWLYFRFPTETSPAVVCYSR